MGTRLICDGCGSEKRIFWDIQHYIEEAGFFVVCVNCKKEARNHD